MANNEKKNEMPAEVSANKVEKTKAEKKEKAEKKKNGFFAKIGKFFVMLGGKIKGLKAEWKKISWASFKSTSKNFLLVLVIVTCFAVALGIIDTVCGLGVTGLSELGSLIFKG